MNMFLECDLDNGTIEIGEHTYIVNPGDLTIVCLWTPTVEVKIKKLNTKSMFNLEIINEDNNEKIFAYRED